MHNTMESAQSTNEEKLTIDSRMFDGIAMPEDWVHIYLGWVASVAKEEAEEREEWIGFEESTKPYLY